MVVVVVVVVVISMVVVVAAAAAVAVEMGGRRLEGRVVSSINKNSNIQGWAVALAM